MGADPGRTMAELYEAVRLFDFAEPVGGASRARTRVSSGTGTAGGLSPIQTSTPAVWDPDAANEMRHQLGERARLFAAARLQLGAAPAAARAAGAG